MGLSPATALSFAGVIPIRRFDFEREKADFNPSGF